MSTTVIQDPTYGNPIGTPWNGSVEGNYVYSNTTSKWYPIIQGADDNDSGDGDGTSTDQKDDGTSTDKDDQKTGDDKVFTQDQLNAIVTRETQKATRGKLDPKELGFESAGKMKEFLEQMKEKTDQDKTDAEKAQEAAVKEAKEQATREVLTVANERMLKAEFLLAARDAGVTKTAANDAYVLAKTLDIWEGVEVDDKGNVSGLSDDFFNQLKETKPFLFAGEGEANSGNGDVGAGRRGGGGGKQAKEDEVRSRYSALQR